MYEYLHFTPISRIPPPILRPLCSFRHQSKNKQIKINKTARWSTSKSKLKVRKTVPFDLRVELNRGTIGIIGAPAVCYWTLCGFIRIAKKGLFPYSKDSTIIENFEIAATTTANENSGDGTAMAPPHRRGARGEDWAARYQHDWRRDDESPSTTTISITTSSARAFPWTPSKLNATQSWSNSLKGIFACHTLTNIWIAYHYLTSYKCFFNDSMQVMMF